MKNKLRVEYLIVADKLGSICTDEEGFIKLLQASDSLDVEDDRILFRTDPVSSLHSVINAEVSYSLQSGTVQAKDQVYYHLVLVTDEYPSVDSLECISEKIKEVVKSINLEKTEINTLWDDVGQTYAKKAYPLVFEVENKMRMLITRFMLVNVGLDWSMVSVKEDVRKQITDRFMEEGRDTSTDFLSLSNFDHLPDVLFLRYRDLVLNDIDKVLEKKDILAEDIEYMKGILPRSNWERYFSDIIEFDEGEIKKKWEILYGLRNRVAHNRFISKDDFMKIRGIAEELIDIIDRTIVNLDKISLNEGQKAQILVHHLDAFYPANSDRLWFAICDWYQSNFPVKEYGRGKFHWYKNEQYKIPGRIKLKDERSIGLYYKYLSPLEDMDTLLGWCDNCIRLAQGKIRVGFVDEVHFLLVFQHGEIRFVYDEGILINELNKRHEEIEEPISFTIGAIDSRNTFSPTHSIPGE